MYCRRPPSSQSAKRTSVGVIPALRLTGRQGIPRISTLSIPRSCRYPILDLKWHIPQTLTVRTRALEAQVAFPVGKSLSSPAL